MTSITMAPECLDNLLPAGAGERREADYPCFAVTLVIMYHLDGSTANTAWVPARPFALPLLLFIHIFLCGWVAYGCLPLHTSLRVLAPKHPATFTVNCAEAKGKGFRQGTDRSPHGDMKGWGRGGNISHVPSLHHTGTSGKENPGKNLSVLLIYAPQTCRDHELAASPLHAEVSHWCGGATQGSLGFTALMRKVETQQVWPSTSFLLLFSPCPLSPYLSGHKTDTGLQDLRSSP